jgi:hypothetical protein
MTRLVFRWRPNIDYSPSATSNELAITLQRDPIAELLK